MKAGDVMCFSKILRCSNIKEFIRITISDDKLKLSHFKNKAAIKNFEILLKENHKIFNYLLENLSVSIELIIASNTMFNRPINLRNLKESDIKALAKNLLIDNKGSTNLIAYEKKLSYKNGFVNICNMNLSSAFISILDDLLKIKNPIVSISTWPLWLVSSYFQLYPMDLNKLEVSVFVGEYENKWEILAIQDKKLISYRQGNIENFNKKVETENVLSYITHIINVSLEDIVIYSINEDTISDFSSVAPINMRLVSKSETFTNFNRNQNLNTIFKTACMIGFLIAFSTTIFDVFKIFDYKNHIQENGILLEGISSVVAKDLSLWNKLREYNYAHHIVLKNELQKEIDAQKKLKNVNIEIDEKSNKLTINSIYEENNR